MKELVDVRNEMMSTHNDLPPELKDEEVSDMLKEDSLWSGLVLTRDFLQPLVDMITTLEHEKSNLGDVVQLYRELQHTWDMSARERGSHPCRKEACNKLVGRYDNFCTPEHLAANLLHPVHRGELLTEEEKATASNWIVEFAGGSLEDQQCVGTSLTSFMTNSRAFTKSKILQLGLHENPQKWWQSVPFYVNDISPSLVDIGMRLGALPASSASSERAWSALGVIHTKRRNRLTNDKLEKLGIIYINLRLVIKGNKRQRLQAVQRAQECDSEDYDVMDEDPNLEL